MLFDAFGTSGSIPLLAEVLWEATAAQSLRECWRMVASVGMGAGVRECCEGWGVAASVSEWLRI